MPGGAPRTLFIPLKGALGTLFSWLVTENPSREVATKDHFASNPRKGNPPDLKTKVDVSKVDVKGFPMLKTGDKEDYHWGQNYYIPFVLVWGIIFFNYSGKEKHINITNLRDCPGPGWVPKMCLRVFGSFLMGEKTHKQNFTKNPGTIP